MGLKRHGGTSMNSVSDTGGEHLGSRVAQRGKRISLAKCIALFGIGLGVGVPCLFLFLSGGLQLARMPSAESMFSAMVWLEAFRMMFWPSSVLLLASSPSGELPGGYLLAAVLLNVLLYGLVGALAWITLSSRGGQVVLVLVLAVGLYALNSYWSSHLTSFFAGAILLILSFAFFYWRFGGYGARGSPLE